MIFHVPEYSIFIIPKCFCHVLHFFSFYYTLCQISVQPRCQHVYLTNTIINNTTDNKWLVDLTCTLEA